MHRKPVRVTARAVALGGLTPDLRGMHGHALHMFERKLPEAEEELLQSLRDRPRSANAFIRVRPKASTSTNLFCLLIRQT